MATFTSTPGNWHSTGPSQTQVGTGVIAERQGLQNLLLMLQQQGRVDPRLLASAQAQNARSTQQQMDAARGSAARSGMSRGGLQAALQAAIGSAGASRSANLNYQDIADSYGRNQQNLGLMSQLVQQPALGYANLQQGNFEYGRNRTDRQNAAAIAFASSIIGGAGKAVGGGA